jgi:hypothetical protein
MVYDNRSAQAMFTPSGRGEVNKAISARRDVRRFLSSPFPADAIDQVFLAAGEC